MDHKLYVHLITSIPKNKSITDWKPTQDQTEPKSPLLVSSRRKSYSQSRLFPDMKIIL